jgi:hypothetical protein
VKQYYFRGRLLNADSGPEELAIGDGEVLLWRRRLLPSITGIRYTSAVEPVVFLSAPFGRARIGLSMWRVLSELQLPLHRRAVMAPAWIKAMQARYWVKADNGLPGFFVPGNQKGVLEVFDRIRREAGDFDAEEVKELN